MNNQQSTVLQNTTNVYSEGSTLHAFFQNLKRPSEDDGTSSPLGKKQRIEAVEENQEPESSDTTEDVVEEARVPRTNTFKMLRNMHRMRNVLAQPSSAYSVPSEAVAES